MRFFPIYSVPIQAMPISFHMQRQISKQTYFHKYDRAKPLNMHYYQAIFV